MHRLQHVMTKSISLGEQNTSNFFRIFPPFLSPETIFKVYETQLKRTRINVTKTRFQVCRIFSPYPSLETTLEKQKTRFKHWISPKFMISARQEKQGEMTCRPVNISEKDIWNFFLKNVIHLLQKSLLEKSMEEKFWKKFQDFFSLRPTDRVSTCRYRCINKPEIAFFVIFSGAQVAFFEL